MTKKTIIILLLIAGTGFAQTGGSSSVELPEFVITGTERVKLPILKKRRPQLVSALSEEFFLPTYSADQVSLVNFDNPLKQKINKDEKRKKYDGKLILASGNYALPYGRFIFDKNIRHALLQLNVFGLNQLDYLEKSRYNVSGAKAVLTFFVSKNSKFLPGLKIKTSVDAYRDSYNLFGAASKPKRETRGGESEVSFNYELSHSVNFDFGAVGSLVEEPVSAFNSKDLKLYGESEFSVANLGIKIFGEFKYFDTKYADSPSETKQYLNSRVTLKYRSSNTFSADFGSVFSAYGSRLFIAPIAYFQIKVDNNISMFAEYNPYTEVISSIDYLRDNRYIELSEVGESYVEHTSMIKIAFKYEHNKQFETGAGISFETIKDIPYYEDRINTGVFEIFTIPKARRFSAFADFLLHTDRYGQFYTRLLFNDTRNKSYDIVPYQPVIEYHGSYTYTFKFGLTGTLSADYYSQIYTDLLNLNKLDDYLNLSLNLKYKISSKLKLLMNLFNLTDNKNYLLKEYQLTPLEIRAGIEYRW